MSWKFILFRAYVDMANPTYFDIFQFPDLLYRTMIVSERFVLEWFVDYLNDCDLYCLGAERVDDCVYCEFDLRMDDNLHLRHNYTKKENKIIIIWGYSQVFHAVLKETFQQKNYISKEIYLELSSS